LNDALTKPLGKVDKQLTSRLNAMGTKWQNAGKSLTRGITLPALAIGALAIKAIDDSEQAEAKLRNALRLTGKETDANVEALKEYASERQKVTTFDDEAAVNAMAMVQQLGNISVFQLQQMLPGMQDFAAAWNMSLEQVGNITGKTLSSSTNAFGRYGLQLDSTMTKQQKLAAINDFFAKKFGGTAEAMATKGLGPLKQLKNMAGDMLEKFGSILLPFLNNLIKNFLSPIINFLDKMSDSTKSLLLTLITIGAAAGPVISMVGKLIKTFSAGFTPLHGFLIGIAALAAGLMLLSEAVHKAETYHQDRAKAIKDEMKDTKKLESEYDVLAGKTNLNSREKFRMATIEGILRKRIGETAFEVDKQTGALKRNTKASEDYYKRSKELRMRELELGIKADEERIKEGWKQVERLRKMSDAEKAVTSSWTIDIDKLEKDVAAAEQNLIKQKEELIGLKDGEDDLTDTTDELSDSMKNLGEEEEKPLLTIPTKVKKLLTGLTKPLDVQVKGTQSVQTQLDAVASAKGSVDVRIKIDTDPGINAKVTQIKKTGDANVRIDINNLLGETVNDSKRYY
jgi:hypothetical protein